MKRFFTRYFLSLIGGPIGFILIINMNLPEGMTPEGLSVLATTVWVAIWWISEAVPIPATSLIPLVTLPATKAVSISAVSAAYGHNLVFLYVGGFILALAIEKWNLHKRIALHIINLVGTSERLIILGFMIATGFLSMWISNTATSVMMLPIGMAIVSQLKSSSNGLLGEGFGKALMLGIAYSASIGGISTLIGTPPNLVLASVVQEYYHLDLDFAKWMAMVFPIALIMLMLCWYYLTHFSFKVKSEPLSGGKNEIKKQLENLGKITFEEKMVLAVFFSTAFLWITRTFLITKILPSIDDTIISLSAAIVLFIIPAKKEKTIMNWETAVKLPWGIVLLFGGGLAIAEGFKSTELATWLGSQMHVISGSSTFTVLLSVVTLVNFLTEITSNVATTAMILPVLAPLAETIGENPILLMTGATLAASCAFMLPVATPPNAVVFGSGYLKMKDMVLTGLALNIISILVITLYLYFVLPFYWPA